MSQRTLNNILVAVIAIAICIVCYRLGKHNGSCPELRIDTVTAAQLDSGKALLDTTMSRVDTRERDTIAELRKDIAAIQKQYGKIIAKFKPIYHEIDTTACDSQRAIHERLRAKYRQLRAERD